MANLFAPTFRCVRRSFRMKPAAEPGRAAQPAPYLVALRIAGKKVLVIGGGQIGTGKIETLLSAEPRLVVVDPTPSDRVLDLASRGEIELRRRRFCPLDMFGSKLIVAATGDSQTNRRIRRWARTTRALVNAVDDPKNCDVTVPSVVRRGPATIAISTGGATPAGARFLREELSAVVDEVLPLGSGHVLETAGHVRHQLRSEGSYRFDYHGWRSAFFEPAFSQIRSGRGSLATVVANFLEHERTAAAPAVSGSVTLVGAGPGGADLITLRGARALAKADVVVYDRLADAELLRLAPAAAERIPVGKGKGFGHTQCEINALLVTRARQGQKVVRLKGGDPFVFGRGGEEVSALTEASIPVEVVPGVSSALAAAALAGIPVTDRRLASSFTVLTGHAAEASAFTTGLPGGTLVVLMAATTAAQVAAQMIAAGRPGDEPVAFVHHAGSANQAVATSRLERVVDCGCPFPSPTVMIVGQVVDFAPSPVATSTDLAISDAVAV